MIKAIKTWVLKNTRSKEINTTTDEYNKLLDSTLSDPLLIESVYNTLVVFIVRSNFVIKTSDLLILLRDYNVNLEVYTLLVYKVGILTQKFVSDPSLILQRAITLKASFSNAELITLQSMLDSVTKAKADNTIADYEKVVNKDKEFNTTPLTDDEEANKLIGEWLKKNKR